MPFLASLHTTSSGRLPRAGLVFSRVRLGRFVGLGTCACSPGTAAALLRVRNKWSLVIQGSLRLHSLRGRRLTEFTARCQWDATGSGQSFWVKTEVWEYLQHRLAWAVPWLFEPWVGRASCDSYYKRFFSWGFLSIKGRSHLKLFSLIATVSSIRG